MRNSSIFVLLVGAQALALGVACSSSGSGGGGGSSGGTSSGATSSGGSSSGTTSSSGSSSGAGNGACSTNYSESVCCNHPLASQCVVFAVVDPLQTASADQETCTNDLDTTVVTACPTAGFVGCCNVNPAYSGTTEEVCYYSPITQETSGCADGGWVTKP